MSEVLSEVIEKIYKTKRKLTGINCAICGNIVHAKNDSCESMKHQDICPAYIGEFVTKYINDSKYDSAYINIDRYHVWSKDCWE